MTEGMQNLLWKYYAKAAEVFGRQTKVDEETGEKIIKQANYSLLWFYLDKKEQRQANDLTRAFLGDADARSRLCWNERLTGDLEGYFLEGEKNHPNESQIRAIRMALVNPISFIQGPPGTGKTTTILNLVSCIAAMGKTVAIVSSNKNAMKTIWKKTDNFAEGAECPNQKRVKEGLAKLGNRELRSQFNKEHGLTGEEAFKSESVQYLPYSSVSREIHVEFQSFLRQYPVITSTINSLKCCFKNEDRLCYDYVIMDESSQVDTVKGLLAMSCAKHLVLVGDEQQLPPVLNQEQIDQMEREWEEEGYVLPSQIHRIYGMQAERSFLEVCLDVFREQVPWVKVFLEEHYRCHPGIIEFCNRREIYNGALKIMTKDYDESVKVPIKVLWFEGDYCESCYESDKGKRGDRRKSGDDNQEAGGDGAASESGGGSDQRAGKEKDGTKGSARPDREEERERSTKRNRKQADIFMTEELPELIRRMGSSEEDISSVCILSPFRGQLKELKDRIKQYNEQNSGELQVFMADEKAPEGKKQADGRKQGDEDGDEKETPMITISPSTIHRSQGDEFDIVYLLPVEDGDWEWPWSQQKRLVNVAVSRAKKELRLIVSSVMMSPALQQELTGRGPAGNGEESEGDEACQTGTEEGRDEVDSQMFIQKLADYVRENATESDHEKGFGFHRAKKSSLFDLGYWKRQQGSVLGKKQWIPELCVEDAIREMPFFAENRLEFYHNVRIGDIQDDQGRTLDFSGLREELTTYVENGAEFDFIVCKEGRILLAVEVDGLYHRFDYNQEVLKRQKGDDEKKNELVESFFHGLFYQGNGRQQELRDGSFAFIRLPSDGSTYLETRALWEEGEEAEKQRVFPLEELLERQLRYTEGSSYWFTPMLFTDMFNEYQRSGAAWVERYLGTENPKIKLRQILVDGRYLKLEGNRSVPTKRGIRQGIVRGCRINQRGGIYITPFYLKRMSDFLRTRLETGEGFWERETVEELAGRLYDQLKEFVQGLGEAGEPAQPGTDGSRMLVPPDWSRTAAPDYSNIHMQELYLLRYLSAYACEYTQIYRELADSEECGIGEGTEPVEVISIGCGNMVDYWGISEALTQKGRKAPVHYLGVDRNDWKEACRIGERAGDQVRYLQQDAAVFLREQGRLTAGLFVFPKSISEFPEEVFEDICESFGSREFARDRICILIAFRSNGNGPNPWPEDNERCDRLIQAMEQKGFRREQDQLRVPGDEEKNTMIWDADPQFAYMRTLYPEVKELFEEFGRKLPGQAENLTRSPMLHAYVCYRVVMLRKE